MAFTDRVVAYPNRYLLTQATDSSGTSITDTYDITAVTGDVTTEGTALNAENLTTEIQSLIDSSIDGITISSAKNVHFQNLQSGSVLCKSTSNAVKSTTVTFPTAFTTAPHVTVTPVTEVPQKVSVGVSGITKTSFTINLYRTTATSTTIQWTAFV